MRGRLRIARIVIRRQNEATRSPSSRSVSPGGASYLTFAEDDLGVVDGDWRLKPVEADSRKEQSPMEEPYQIVTKPSKPDSRERRFFGHRTC